MRAVDERERGAACIDYAVEVGRNAGVAGGLGEAREQRCDLAGGETLDGVRLQGAAQRAHERGRLDAVADDIADRSPATAVGKLEDVVPVAADEPVARGG